MSATVREALRQLGEARARVRSSLVGFVRGVKSPWLIAHDTASKAQYLHGTHQAVDSRGFIV
jgi:hypothetical protein